MKIKLYQVVLESAHGNQAWYTEYRPTGASNSALYREVEVDAPDLPTQSEIDEFIEENKGARRQEHIQRLRAELAAMESEG